MSKPLDNWKSGSGHHLDELMKHILDLNDGTFDFTFVHYIKSENAIYKRVNEMIVPRNPFASSVRLRKENFDIVHYAPLTVFSPIWNVKAKKTATIHGIEDLLYPQGYSLIHRLHETYIVPIYMRKMDGIATVSETGRKYFIDHYRIKPEQIFITTNGYGKAYRVLGSEDTITNCIPGINRKFILHISKFSPRKNPITIIEGFAKFIKESSLDFQLVCAGSGWNGIEARQIADKCGLGDRYIAPGFIDEETAVQLLNSAEVFVFPSFAEGFGMPNVEAMACGCPVITSNIFAIPEIVGDAAFVLSRPDDTEEFSHAMQRIVTDTGYKKTLVERGLERAKLYNWTDSANALLNYWKRLVSD